jgi:DNA-directed RNA polymerase specialized sigma24 family protein
VARFRQASPTDKLVHTIVLHSLQGTPIMNDESFHTASLRKLVERIHDGDHQAADELIRRGAGRLKRLTRKMLNSFPKVSKWEETGDVLQNALVRLLGTLGKLKPENTRAFFGLATEHLRRELLDLNRHYQGADLLHVWLEKKEQGKAPTSAELCPSSRRKCFDQNQVRLS